jgi:hypothetical protein
LASVTLQVLSAVSHTPVIMAWTAPRIPGFP